MNIKRAIKKLFFAGSIPEKGRRDDREGRLRSEIRKKCPFPELLRKESDQERTESIVCDGKMRVPADAEGTEAH